MGQEDYPEPKGTLHLGDKGPTVKGFQKAVNRIFDNNGLGRRVPNDSLVTQELLKKGALAAKMVGVPKDEVKPAEKKDKDNRRLTERLQVLVRYGDKRSENQKKNGKQYTKKFKADLASEAASNDPNVINEYFRISDFDCHDGTPVPQRVYDDLRHHVVSILTPLREASGGPVGINSGHRPSAYNASIGGATNSQHIYDKNNGTATDVVSSRWSPSKVYDFLDNLGADGLGRYSSFTHVDSRGYRSRWNG